MKQHLNELSPNLTILGGGGGASTLAAGMVRHLPEVNTTVIVAMSDDGGSTGEQSRQFETMPVGDIRRNIAAVAVSDQITTSLNHRFGSEAGYDELRDIAQHIDKTLRQDTANYDFNRVKKNLELATKIGLTVEGGLKGHTYGNLLLTGLAVEHGFSDAVKEASRMVDAQATIIPVTTTPHTLMMYDGKDIIRGEHNIDVRQVFDSNKAYIWLEAKDPKNDAVQASSEAIEAIENAHLALISPGSPYTSIAPVLATNSIPEALEVQRINNGQLVGIANLENQPHDTADWCVGRYAQFLQRYLGKRVLDAMIYNDSLDELPDPSRAVTYNPQLISSLNLSTLPLNLVGAAAKKDNNDPIKRSDVHHNTLSLANALRTTNQWLGHFAAFGGIS